MFYLKSTTLLIIFHSFKPEQTNDYNGKSIFDTYRKDKESEKKPVEKSKENVQEDVEQEAPVKKKKQRKQPSKKQKIVTEAEEEKQLNQEIINIDIE